MWWSWPGRGPAHTLAWNPEGRRRAVFVLETIVNVISSYDGLVQLDDLAWPVLQDEVGDGMVRGLVVDGRLPLKTAIVPSPMDDEEEDEDVEMEDDDEDGR